MSLKKDEESFLLQHIESIGADYTKMFNSKDCAEVVALRNLLVKLVDSKDNYSQFCAISITIDIISGLLPIESYLDYFQDINDEIQLRKKIEETCLLPLKSCTNISCEYVRLLTKYRYELTTSDPITKRNITEKIVARYGWGYKGARTPNEGAHNYNKETLLWITPKQEFLTFTSFLRGANVTDQCSAIIRFLALPWYKGTHSPADIQARVYLLEYSNTFKESVYQPNTTMGNFGHSFKGRYCSYNDDSNGEFGETCNIHDPTHCAKERVHLNFFDYDTGYSFQDLGFAELLDEEESDALLSFAYERMVNTKSI